MDTDELDRGVFEQSQDDSPGPRRQRVSTACEACRVSKIRCRPSSQPGVCEKCLQSKRECVSRTTPRTRRAKKLRPDDKTKPPGPTSTFTIDHEYAAQHDSDETFTNLLGSHTDMLDQILPTSSPWTIGQLPPPPSASSATPGGGGPEASTTSSFSSPPASTTSGGRTRTPLDTTTTPKFNLSSASALLSSFRLMLPHFPCISLPETARVPDLARSNPFALLAVLASASGSGTGGKLQGHSLYDEEFRKVLALKFVACGERSLALLQGVLIYCAWYPFHLRPRNNQVRQYVRMAGDLVREMGLDGQRPEGRAAPLRREEVRAYLCYHYLISSLTVSWRSFRGIHEPFSAWTSKCCDMLAESDSLDDKVLASLVRIASTVGSACDAMREGGSQTDQQRGLLLLGIEAQLDAICQAMPEDVSQSRSIKIAAQFARVYIIAAPLLRPDMITPDFPPQQKLKLSTHLLRQALVHLSSFPSDDEYAAFSAPEWSRYILSVVLAIRLAFPVANRDWDARWARHTLRLSELFGQIIGADGDDIGTVSQRDKVDVLSAFRIVVRVIRDRYDQRVEALEREEVEAEAARAMGKFGCPMLDGSLSEYIPLWDGGMGMGMGDAEGGGGGASSLLPGAGVDEGNDGATMGGPVFHDLWATMTMGWTENGEDMTL